MKRISIIGSTGSIGRQAIEVCRRYPERFQIVALAANTGGTLFEQQIDQNRPEFAALRTERNINVPKGTRFSCGEKAFEEACSYENADIVLIAVTGFAGLKAALSALSAGKDIALANKESLVVGGQLVMPLAERKGLRVLPVDSEHSAIWQCLNFDRKAPFRKILLTASGGALRDVPMEKLGQVTAKDALAHPNWKMGPKITIDCATMLNKGFEVMEAMHLYGAALSQIEVLVHRESIVHSMVEFADGAVLAQLGVPDMRVPIAYAMTYPRRIPTGSKPLDLFSIGTLTFEPGDPVRFPALRLAGECLNAGGAACTILNGANEIAVAAFLRDVIPFGAISRIVEGTLEACGAMPADTLDDIFHADLEARRVAKEIAEKLK